MHSKDYCGSRRSQHFDNRERKRALYCEAVNLGCLSQQFPRLDAECRGLRRLSVAAIKASIYAMTRPLVAGGIACPFGCDVQDQLKQAAEEEISKVKGLSFTVT